MEELRQELNQVIEVAGNITGIHKRVAEKVGLTPNYIEGIRSGRRLTNDKPKNQKKLQNLINEYKKEVLKMSEYAKEIEVVL